MKTLFILLGITLAIGAQAQQHLPEMQLTKTELEGHMRFLASDALEGRRTGSRGNNLAASYLAAYFEAYGVKKVPGMDSYFQPVLFQSVAPAKDASLKIGKTTYKSGEDFLILAGDAQNTKTSIVFAGHGWVDAKTGHDDYKDLDVKGKVVLVLPGTPDDQSMTSMFSSGSKKRQFAAERGAAAILEVYRLQFPWNLFKNFVDKENIILANPNVSNNAIAYGWFKEPNEDNPVKELQDKKSLKVAFQHEGALRKDLPSQNVIGVIEGSDPVLKNEYILLTAHYDHVGVGAQGGGTVTPQDSIFNGARDNAFGTVSLLAAAKTLAQHPIKRSVIVLAVTGEEIGLLGSKYYADNPLIPLEKTVFNLNTDAAGYNDTKNVMVVGIEHVPIRETLEKGAAAFGLGVLDDPMPEQNLFVRSDHYSFVVKGVPAIFITPAITSFDASIQKYYHQVSDNPDSIDYDYLLKYCQAYAHTARLVGDNQERPTWKAGDKYEKAGKELYKN